MGGCSFARVYPERSSVRRIRITASRLGLQLDRLYRDRFRWELHVFLQYYRRNIEFERFPASGTWHPATAQSVFFYIHIGGGIQRQRCILRSGDWQESDEFWRVSNHYQRYSPIALAHSIPASRLASSSISLDKTSAGFSAENKYVRTLASVLFQICQYALHRTGRSSVSSSSRGAIPERGASIRASIWFRSRVRVSS